MKVTFRQSFARNLKKIKDKAVLEQIKRAAERVETAQNLCGMKELGKLSGNPRNPRSPRKAEGADAMVEA